MSARYGTSDGTVWPVPWSDDPDVNGPEWLMRYGPNKDVFVASIVAAYKHLVDPSLSQAEAVQSLRRARRAVRGAS